MPKKIILPDGSIRWEVRVRAGGRCSRAFRKRFETKTDAENFELNNKNSKHRSKLLGDGIEEFSETTFRKEAEFWLNVRGPDLSPGYKKRCEEILEYLLPRWGNLPPLRFHFGLLNEMRTQYRSRGTIKAATVNRMTNVVTGILRHSAENKRIPYNPAASIRRLREEKKEVCFWEKSEASSFLAYANAKYPERDRDKRWIYLVYLLTLNTGLRAGEVWGLTPRALLRGPQELHIFQQFDRVARRLRPLKDHEERVTPCNSDLRHELMLHIERNNLGPDDLIFQNEDGGGKDHDNFRNRIFWPDVKACGGIRRITFHNLRDTAATLMIAQGVDVVTVQKILGHEDISTTMRYVHALKDSVKKVATIFNILPEIPTNMPAAQANGRPKLRLVR